MTNDDILIETKRIGTILRVTAIDPVSETEVVFQAPVKTSRRDLERLAVNKLRYVISKI
jgi:hypothetical protein